MSFGILLDDRFLAHHDTGYHPECPERLSAIRMELQDRGLWQRSRVTPGREATLDELTSNHSRAYVEAALERMQRAAGHFDADTFFSTGSREASLLAAGGTVDLVKAVIDRSLDFGLALVRPPGHHATPGRAMGFCIFNNIAIAARAALATGQVERILIYDWDVHHGNGTQDSFWGDDRVLYVSTHQWPFYPGSGLSDETGSGRGAGYTMNFPLPAGAGDDEFCFVMREAILPLAQEYHPDLILVSAGFDAHANDLLGSMRLTEDGYAAMTRVLADAAASLCKGRIAFVLEGGYHIESQARSVAAIVETMLGAQVEIPDGTPRQQHRDVIDRTRMALAHHWKSVF